MMPYSPLKKFLGLFTFREANIVSFLSLYRIVFIKILEHFYYIVKGSNIVSFLSLYRIVFIKILEHFHYIVKGSLILMPNVHTEVKKWV